jgi:predicted DNA-binding transcriptional regulator YafY
VVERTVDPLGLVAKATIWYLVCRYTGPASELRVFRVSRVLEAREQGETGTRPPDFDLAEYWRSWSEEFSAMLPRYTVSVCIHREAVPSIISDLGQGVASLIQNASWQRDGTAELLLTFDSLDHARSRLLALGILVQVLEPAELRESILDYASRILTLYAAPVA